MDMYIYIIQKIQKKERSRIKIGIKSIEKWCSRVVLRFLSEIILMRFDNKIGKRIFIKSFGGGTVF